MLAVEPPAPATLCHFPLPLHSGILHYPANEGAAAAWREGPAGRPLPRVDSGRLASLSGGG